MPEKISQFQKKYDNSIDVKTIPYPIYYMIDNKYEFSSQELFSFMERNNIYLIYSGSYMTYYDSQTSQLSESTLKLLNSKPEEASNYVIYINNFGCKIIFEKVPINENNRYIISEYYAQSLPANITEYTPMMHYTYRDLQFRRTWERIDFVLRNDEFKKKIIGNSQTQTSILFESASENFNQQKEINCQSAEGSKKNQNTHNTTNEEQNLFQK